MTSEDGCRAPAGVLWGVAALLVVVPLLDPQGFGNPTTAPRYAVNGVGVAVLAIVGIGRTMARRRAGASPASLGGLPVALMSTYVALALLSTAWAIDKSGAIVRSFEVGTFYGAFLLSAWIARTSPQATLHWLVRSATLTGGALGLLAIAQSLGHATSVFEQVLGGPAATFGNKNVLATYLGALLFPSLIWVLGGGKKGRFLRGLPFVLVLAGLTVTRSRGGWLAALLAGLVLAGACAVSRRQRRVATLVLRRSTPWLVVGGVLALVLAGTPAPPGSSAGSVLANAAQADVATSSLAVRRAFDTSSLAMLRDHPFGVGLGSWRAAYPAYARLAPTTDFSLTLQPWEAHCDPLEIFCETGILGGLAFFLAIGATVRAALRPQAGESTARKLGSLLISLGVIEVLLHSLVDFPLRRPASALLFHVWLGLLAGSERGGKPAFSAISRPVLRGAGARPSASTSGDAGDGGPTFTGALVMIAAAASIVFHLRGIVADRRVAEARRSADTRTMYDRFQRAEALFPYSFQLHREAARTAHLGCYQGVVPCPVARAAIGRVLADEPHQPRYLTDEGALALQAGDDETARRAYTKAVAVLPAEPACLEGLASVEERLGDHDCATALRAAARDLRSGR